MSNAVEHADAASAPARPVQAAAGSAKQNQTVGRERRNRMDARCALAVLAVAGLAGCSDDGWEARQVTQVGPDGNRLSVTVHCHPDARATADESGDTVVVTFEVRGEHMGDCYGVAVAELERPLGGRQVVDATSGEPVPVGPHP